MMIMPTVLQANCACGCFPHTFVQGTYLAQKERKLAFITG
jgi:hypothetical protein